MQNDIQEILKIEGVNSRGFGIIPKVVMFDKNLSIEAKAIYAYLSSHAGAGTTAFPSRNTILKSLNISKDYYYKHFNNLKEQGYIKVELVGTFPRKNVYTLVNEIKRENEIKKDESKLKYGRNTLKSQGYGIIPRLLMIDNRLHIKAKSIYAYLCSLLGNGATSFPQVSSILYHLQIGKEAYYKYYNQLIEYNYITVIQRKSQDGKFSFNDYYINENPYPALQDTDKKQIKSRHLPSTDLPDTDLPDTDLPDTKINNININNININNQSIENDTDRLIESIKTKISYDYLKLMNRNDIELIDTIYNILLNTLNSKKEYFKVSGEFKKAEDIKKILLQLDYNHIQYVINSFNSTNSKIKNIDAYILTSLIKSPQTIDIYYKQLVKSDLKQ